MKKLVTISTVFAFLLAVTASVQAAKPVQTDSNGVEVSWQNTSCTTIQDGVLKYSAGHYLEGELLTVGYDEYGYNYQAHMFKGSYANAYLGGAGFPAYTGDADAYQAAHTDVVNKWYWPYRDVNLSMKWDDMWLANTDCTRDGKLDRHYDYTSYIGSGAWITNHMSGEDSGETWTYFTKIVAAPTGATIVGGNWNGVDGVEIGPVIWGEFAILQEVESGMGATYVSPSGPGFGQY